MKRTGKSRVLVVDSDPFDSSQICKHLNKLDLDVFPFSNKYSILEYIHKYSPDLVIVDDVSYHKHHIHLFQNNPLTETIPVLLLTAKFEHSSIIQELESGVDIFLFKPLNYDLLSVRVKSTINKYKRLRKKFESQMNDLRDDISFSLPHEFRTSISNILGFASTINKYTSGDHIESEEIQEINEMSEFIVDSAKYLTRLTENFLLYSQVQFFKLNDAMLSEIKNEVLYNPIEIIEETVFFMTNKTDRNNDIICELINVPIKISSYYFRKMISEILDNALKFSTTGTPITINSYIKDYKMNISISDEGRGMTKDQIENITAYKQFNRNIFEQQGTGLGLEITKQLTELHDGYISLESLDKGLNVIISLPIKLNQE